MDNHIAYCGLDCEICDARIATMHHDDALREKTAKLWSQLNGVEITKEMINCTGCKADGVKTPFCDTMCEIRKCAGARGFATCADCAELERCTTLKTITATSSEASENLEKLRKHNP